MGEYIAYFSGGKVDEGSGEIARENVDVYNIQVQDYSSLQTAIRKRLKALRKHYLEPTLERLVEVEEVDIDELMLDEEDLLAEDGIVN